MESRPRSEFIPWLNRNNVGRPVILTYDAHVSHLTYTMAHELANEIGIALHCLPTPNTMDNFRNELPTYRQLLNYHQLLSIGIEDQVTTYQSSKLVS